MHASSKQRARRVNTWLAIPLIAVFALAACGGGDSGGSGGGAKAANGCTSKAPNTSGAVSNAGNAPAKVPGFDGTTIKLGALTPQSQVLSAVVVGGILTYGNEVYWKSVNARGGIGGKYKVELVTEDTQYSPTVAPQAYQKIKDQVVAMNQVFGTQVTKSVLTTMGADNMSGSPATLDAEWICDTNLFPIGTPYQVQAINGMSWWVNKSGKNSVVCTMVQDDSYGDAVNTGVDYAAKKLGFTVKTKQKFPVPAPDLTPQVQALKDAGCQAVVLGTLPGDTAAIGTKAQSIGLTTQLIGVSPSFFPLYAANPYLQSNYVVVTEGPAWGDTSVPGMAQMMKDVDAHGPKVQPGSYFSFGYAQSWALEQILTKAIANGDLSRGGIQKAASEVGTLKFDGLLGDYTYGANVADRNPLRANTV
ncbi:MAG: ABC transporter substrate-binding protein, partial [Acidimicrobiia bacterium]